MIIRRRTRKCRADWATALVSAALLAGSAAQAAEQVKPTKLETVIAVPVCRAVTKQATGAPAKC